jgi:hypothetical protein
MAEFLVAALKNNPSAELTRFSRPAKTIQVSLGL